MKLSRGKLGDLSGRGVCWAFNEFMYSVGVEYLISYYDLMP